MPAPPRPRTPAPARPANAPASLRPPRPRNRPLLGRACAGIARELGVDPLIVRLAFVAGAAAGGVGVVVYAGAWALLGDDRGERSLGARLPRTGRAGLEVA